MRKIGLLAVSVLAAGVLAVSGCQNAGTSKGSGSAAEEVRSTVKSRVQFEGSYIAGDTVQIRMILDKEGNCEYGYIGQYSMETDESGNQLLKLVYYTDSDAQEAADTYAIRKNEDGTYARCKYTDGEEPDFSDAVTMTLEEGEDGILSGNAFEGTYYTSESTYMILRGDSTFTLGVRMKYAADKKQFEMIGAGSSVIYNYETDKDQDHIVLTNEDGKTVMDLEREE